MTVRLEWHDQAVIRRVGDLLQFRGARAVNIVAADIQRRLATPYPPASRPGRPPKRRSGRLFRGVRGFAVIIGKRVRLTVVSERAGGDPRVPLYLQHGTRHMYARPYIFRQDREKLARLLMGRG